ncbi:MAG: efflux RND transporter periplasmic adaptor subunit [Candidatus Scalindua sp.]|nr:efflux RND transporter periplasmic adaptor subunit [Candidatus Scalindua sp.]
MKCSRVKNLYDYVPLVPISKMVSTSMLILISSVLSLARNECMAQGDPPAAPVAVSRIVQMEVPRPVKMVGTVFPLRESMVACEVKGLVKAFPVKRGDRVKKGQVLAQLTTISLEIQLKGARADKHLALLKFQRAEELFESATISHQELDEFEMKLVAQEAVVDAIEDNIGKCTVTAPFDGRITEEYTEVGQWLDQGEKVVSMIELNSVKIRVPVPEKYLQNVKVGDECKVSISALGGIIRTGHILHIVPQADTRSRTFPIYIKLDNEDEMIKSGMFAEATFEVGPLLSATMILKDGIVRRVERKFIYLAIDGKAIEVPISTGVSYKNLIQVFDDVEPGTDVIVRGNERLRDGQSVRVTGRIDPDT